MKKSEILPEVQEQMETLSRRMGSVSGAVILDKIKDRTKTDFSAMVFNEGDRIDIPKEDKYLYESISNGESYYGFIVQVTSKEGVVSAKTLPFSFLDRGIAEYGDDLKPTGKIVNAKTETDHEVFDIASNCATELEVRNKFAGTQLIVPTLNPVKAARYRNGQIVGTRNRNVAVFKFA